MALLKRVTMTSDSGCSAGSGGFPPPVETVEQGMTYACTRTHPQPQPLPPALPSPQCRGLAYLSPSTSLELPGCV